MRHSRGEAASSFTAAGRLDWLEAKTRASSAPRSLPLLALSPVVPEQLLGIWNRNITDEAAPHVGVWSLSFDRSGVLVIYEPVGADVPGVRDTITTTFAASASGDLVIGTGPGRTTKRVYRWEIANAFLRLQEVSDDCPRRAAMIPGDWAQ